MEKWEIQRTYFETSCKALLFYLTLNRKGIWMVRHSFLLYFLSSCLISLFKLQCICFLDYWLIQYRICCGDYFQVLISGWWSYFLMIFWDKNLCEVDKLKTSFSIFLICLIHLCDYLLTSQWDIFCSYSDFLIYFITLSQFSTTLFKNQTIKTLKKLFQ